MSKHLIEPNDLSNEEILKLIEVGKEIQVNPKKYNQLCSGKILASLFFEPSTRTKFSFDAAMIRLGGHIIGFADANTSSAKKGESLADTIRVMNFYSDIIVMRHPKEGAPKLASEYSNVPIINAGDGGHNHPTQTLTDLLTISKYKKTLENHTIALVGDLKYGRTVHSLIKTLAKFNSKKFILVSPDELKLPSFIIDYLKVNYPEIEITEARYLEDVIEEVDIIYMTRIQKERFFNEGDYIKLKNSFLLNKEKMKKAKKDAIVMHPLPRVNEISYEIDDDPRCVYFDQSNQGVFIRMALITKMLEVGDYASC
ncbi:MAG: aspartate carbamoyltransferase [Clostridiales bacterium]|nr:aspartate carbamoyltransferase [Clostridiales bacterium]